MTQNLKFVFGWVENIVGIRENGGYQYFFLFHQCFQNNSLSGFLILGITWERVNFSFITGFNMDNFRISSSAKEEWAMPLYRLA